MSDNIAIGIDLGTTFCCVSAIRDGKVVVVPNELGNDTTPSYVAFTVRERLIGDGAKNQAVRNPTNTVFDVKRIIGRTYADPVIKDERERKPFSIINENGRPKIEIKKEKNVERYYPEEISGMLLTKLKKQAEAHFNAEINEAVITVPASFNNSQRQCTLDAGAFAGLNVLRLLNEPTAAAMAYGLDRNCPEGHNILVYDLGGGTFDVSIITIKKGVFEVLTSVGDPHLGGQDFDMRLLNHCIDEFIKLTDKNPRGNQKSINLLLRECERAKMCLSSSNNTDIIVDSLYAGEDFSTTITRRQFEYLCKDLFHRTTESLNKALAESNLDKEDIHDVVLAGGSSRIPHIYEILKTFFNDKDIQTTINAKYAIAQGAAILANHIIKFEEKNELVLLEKTSISLGVQKAGGKMEVLIAQNSNIPCKKKKIFSTSQDNKTTVMIGVYEGERELVKDNNELGKFTLRGIPPAPKYTPQIEVTFEIDESGIFHVSATELSIGVMANLVVDLDKKCITDEERSQMMARAETFREQEGSKSSKYRLENYAKSIRVASISTAKLRNECNEVLNWLIENPSASECEYSSRLKELKQKSMGIL